MIVTDGAVIDRIVRAMLSDLDHLPNTIQIGTCEGDLKIIVINSKLFKLVAA